MISKVEVALFVFLCFLSSIWLISGQLWSGIEDINVQPDLFTPISSQCCYSSTTYDFRGITKGCLSNSSYMNSFLVNIVHSAPPIKLITYVTRDIYIYAQHSLSINLAYAEQKRYDMKIFVNGFFFDSNDPNSTSNHSDELLSKTIRSTSANLISNSSKKTPKIIYDVDPRWVKISILHAALNTNWNSTNYIVWLDADLVMMDLGFDIEIIVNDYSNADIILSKDANNHELVANSGFMIIKTSAWSRSFIEKWWSTYDRTKCCDQSAFTWLYDKLNPVERQHIQLLRIDALNSNFPAWFKQKPYNQVLHLAGAPNQLRTKIFEVGNNEVCRSRYWKTIEDKYFVMKWVKEFLVSSCTYIDKFDYFKDTKMLSRTAHQLNLHAQHLKNLMIEFGRDRLSLMRTLIYRSNYYDEYYIDNRDMTNQSILKASSRMPSLSVLGEYDYDSVNMTNKSKNSQQSLSLNLRNDYGDSIINETLVKSFSSGLINPYEFIRSHYLESLNLFKDSILDILKDDHDDTSIFMKCSGYSTTFVAGSIDRPCSEYNRIPTIPIISRVNNINNENENDKNDNFRIGNKSSAFLVKKWMFHSHLHILSFISRNCDDIDTFRAIIQDVIILHEFQSLMTARSLSVTITNIDIDDVIKKLTTFCYKTTFSTEIDYALLKSISMSAMHTGLHLIMELDKVRNIDDIELLHNEQKKILSHVNRMLIQTKSWGSMTNEKDSLDHKFSYLQFKLEQLVAITDIHSTKRRKSHSLKGIEKSINLLKSSIVHWKNMIRQNYYGSAYVLEDPYKEAAETLSLLGSLSCITSKYDFGIEYLFEALSMHIETLNGYASARYIVSYSTMKDGEQQMYNALLNSCSCLLKTKYMFEEKMNCDHHYDHKHHKLKYLQDERNLIILYKKSLPLLSNLRQHMSMNSDDGNETMNILMLPELKLHMCMKYVMNGDFLNQNLTMTLQKSRKYDIPRKSHNKIYT